MMSAPEIIKKAKNTFYINYILEGNDTTNSTTGYSITFPTPALNIKANNAFISIENLIRLELKSSSAGGATTLDIYAQATILFYFNMDGSVTASV